MSSARAEVLVAIDLQEIFADPNGPWGSPMFAAARPRILQRINDYGDDVVLTRFIAPAQPTGAWIEYYRDWPFALSPPDHPQYDLIAELSGRPTTDASTFGKWGPELMHAIDGARSVEILGVATDCCVLATALPMADAGVQVHLDPECCAGSTPENHVQALGIMQLYAPLIRLLR